MSTGACERCLARTWLLGRLAGHLDRARDRTAELMELENEPLIDAVGGGQRSALRDELAAFSWERFLAAAGAGAAEAICRCDPRYPRRLGRLDSPPAVIHVAGGIERFLELAEQDPVAIVGARQASSYGIEVARSLARELATAGLTVVSGMALGIDSAAHAGAIAGGGATVAVLPGGANQVYPASRRGLHRQILRSGAAISELPRVAGIRRWMFPARNRLIAGLAAATIVVEAAERSGALLTAAVATALERRVGAVPGRITSPLAAGPNRLLASGATVVRGAQDVLELLFGEAARSHVPERRPQLAPELEAVLHAVAAGRDSAEALTRSGLEPGAGLAALAALELAGYIRRDPGGRFTVLP